MKRWVAVTLLTTVMLMGAGLAHAALGPRFGIHERVISTDYDQPMHHIRGRIGIVNKAKRPALVKCKVVALLKGPGDTHKKGSDGVKVRIPGGETKRPHFAIEIRDASHRFNNKPSKVAVHCHKVK